MSEKKEKESLLIKCKAQNDLCKRKNWPRFAPYNGICWSCYNQIYSEITLNYARNFPVTGCPHCHQSFCE